MFTGIVEEAGRVVRIAPGQRSAEFVVQTKTVGHGVRAGNSVAVNGACLTVVAARAGRLHFDVLKETLRCTNLGTLKTGDLVNLERPLRADGRVDGHFVLGHVDATGTVRRWEKAGKDYVLEVIAPRKIMELVLYKGSVAVDGISLTVAEAGRDWLRVWIIPHTCRVTNLRARRVGDLVNLEADILGKYVRQLIGRRRKN